jgi:hypothetical protein
MALNGWIIFGTFEWILEGFIGYWDNLIHMVIVANNEWELNQYLLWLDQKKENIHC